MNRRKFILSSIAGAGAITGLYTWQVEPFWLEFVNRKMAIKNLPKSLVGKTLMQISDIHVGNKFDYQFIIDSFIKAKKLNPDYVVYTGDYVNYEDDEQLSQLDEVLPYAVKGTIGTCAVLGNHDYGIDWSEQRVADLVTDSLTKHGILVLQNEQVELEGLNITGIDEVWGTNWDPEKAMSQFDKTKANVVLCHNPDVCDMDIWNGYDSWILSGHTHGGQCKPPFLKAPLLPVDNKDYDQGEKALSNGRTLYINRALGHLIQVRFNVRPEITVFELDVA